MTLKQEIENDYFNWLYSLVYDKGKEKVERVSYRKLLSVLHTREFYFILPMDENRAADGIDLRGIFAWDCGGKYTEDDVLECLDGPCSVLEMMVALAKRIEDDITGVCPQWFWLMIYNLGLQGMHDDSFDREIIEENVTNMLERTYEEDGTGGLFVVKYHAKDLRDVDIWYQMQWYLTENLRL